VTRVGTIACMSVQKSKKPSPASDKPGIDWERIEADYRAGVLSVREVGRLNGVSHTAINKRAADAGWTRDLQPKILAKANAEVSRRMVSTQVSSLGRVSERQVIEANADAIVSVRLSHRHDIRRCRNVLSNLLDELELSCGPENAELLADFANIMRSEDEKGQDKRNDLYCKLLSMSGRAKVMKDLGDSMRVLVTLEREAFSMDDPKAMAEQGATGGAATMTDAERAVRLTRLLNANPDALASLLAMKAKA